MTQINSSQILKSYGIATVAGTQTISDGGSGAVAFNAVSGVNFDLSGGNSGKCSLREKGSLLAGIDIEQI